jgi:hypothetical protein
MCSSLTDPFGSGSGAFSAEIKLYIGPIDLLIGRPVTLRLLLRCRSCETSWASKALAGVLDWSNLQRQHTFWQLHSGTLGERSSFPSATWEAMVKIPGIAPRFLMRATSIIP